MNKKFKLIKITSYNNIEIDAEILVHVSLVEALSTMCEFLQKDKLEINTFFSNFNGKELIYNTSDNDVIFCIVEESNHD